MNTSNTRDRLADIGRSSAENKEGNSIINIEKTSTLGLVDTYTINYTESEPSTFDVTNGAEGPSGCGYNDVSAPNPADGTATITLTNGDTITIDLNHEHPQYPRYELVNALPQDPDSGTLYLIATT